jgi:hypothetical protein
MHPAAVRVTDFTEKTMKLTRSIIAGALAAGICSGVMAQPTVSLGEPEIVRDAQGAPMMFYSGGEPAEHFVIAQEVFVSQPVLVMKEPAVRDTSGNPVGDGSGATVKSVSAAPLSEEAIAIYQADRYLLVPSR